MKDNTPIVRACHEVLMSYGFYVLISVRDLCEVLEHYEVCATIDFVLLSRTGKKATDYPRHITHEQVDDYRAEFWRLGYSGEHAVQNLDHYTLEAMRKIEDARVEVYT